MATGWCPTRTRTLRRCSGRGHRVHLRRRLLRDLPGVADRGRFRRHRRVLPRGGQVPPGRAPRLRGAHDAGGDAGGGREVPGLREDADDRRQHRVDVLADRAEGYRLPGAAGFASFVQLPEILGEIAGVGPKSKSVTAQATALVERFGPELSILGDVTARRPGGGRSRNRGRGDRPAPPRRRAPGCGL